jgi:CRISPR type III-B/RAMP module-associated protein Cmr5
MRRLLLQRRAAFALERINAFRDPACNLSKERKPEKMSMHIHKTPIRILNNGLGQALAFLLADNEGKTDTERKESGQLYKWLQDWLCGECTAEWPCRIYQREDLIAELLASDRRDYIRAQEEMLALFDWLAKFADAYLGKEE